MENCINILKDVYLSLLRNYFEYLDKNTYFDIHRYFNLKKVWIFYILKMTIFNFKEYMVGRVGYAPTTPAMSMQYSTIELTARVVNFLRNFLIV